jgi:hypothetical protein
MPKSGGTRIGRWFLAIFMAMCFPAVARSAPVDAAKLDAALMAADARLTEWSTSADSAKRAFAVSFLSRLASPCWESVRDALAFDSSLDVRLAVVEGIGIIGDRSPVARRLLLDALSSDSAITRHVAVTALARLGWHPTADEIASVTTGDSRLDEYLYADLCESRVAAFISTQDFDAAKTADGGSWRAWELQRCGSGSAGVSARAAMRAEVADRKLLGAMLESAIPEDRASALAELLERGDAETIRELSNPDTGTPATTALDDFYAAEDRLAIGLLNDAALVRVIRAWPADRACLECVLPVLEAAGSCNIAPSELEGILGANEDSAEKRIAFGLLSGDRDLLVEGCRRIRLPSHDGERSFDSLIERYEGAGLHFDDVTRHACFKALFDGTIANGTGREKTIQQLIGMFATGADFEFLWDQWQNNKRQDFLAMLQLSVDPRAAVQNTRLRDAGPDVVGVEPFAGLSVPASCDGPAPLLERVSAESDRVLARTPLSFEFIRGLPTAARLAFQTPEYQSLAEAALRRNGYTWVSGADARSFAIRALARATRLPHYVDLGRFDRRDRLRLWQMLAEEPRREEIAQPLDFLRRQQLESFVEAQSKTAAAGLGELIDLERHRISDYMNYVPPARGVELSLVRSAANAIPVRDAMRKYLASPDIAIRHAYAIALWRLFKDDVGPKRLLQDVASPEGHTRQSALQHLAELRWHDAEPLFEAALHGNDARDRIGGMAGVELLRIHRLIPRVEDRLVSVERREIEVACAVLAWCHRQSSWMALLPLLGGPSQDYALYALDSMSQRDFLPAVLSLLPTIQDARQRSSLLVHLAWKHDQSRDLWKASEPDLLNIIRTRPAVDWDALSRETIDVNLDPHNPIDLRASLAETYGNIPHDWPDLRRWWMGIGRVRPGVEVSRENAEIEAWWLPRDWQHVQRLPYLGGFPEREIYELFERTPVDAAGLVYSFLIARTGLDLGDPSLLPCRDIEPALAAWSGQMGRE